MPYYDVEGLLRVATSNNNTINTPFFLSVSREMELQITLVFEGSLSPLVRQFSIYLPALPIITAVNLTYDGAAAKENSRITEAHNQTNSSDANYDEAQELNIYNSQFQLNILDTLFVNQEDTEYSIGYQVKDFNFHSDLETASFSLVNLFQSL